MALNDAEYRPSSVDEMLLLLHLSATLTAGFMVWDVGKRPMYDEWFALNIGHSSGPFNLAWELNELNIWLKRKGNVREIKTESRPTVMYRTKNRNMKWCTVCLYVCLSVMDVLWLNSARYGLNCYWRLIGNRIRRFRWDESHRPWMTLKFGTATGTVYV